MISLENKNIKLSFFLISLLIWLFLEISLQSGYKPYIGYISSILLMTQSFWLVVRSCLARKTILFVLFSFISLYTWPPKLFFFDGLSFSAHNLNLNYAMAAKVTLLFTFFLMIVNVKLNISKKISVKPITLRDNSIIFYLLYIFTFIIVLYARRSGNTYDGITEDIKVSSLNEYVLILFYLLYVYTGGKKTKIKLFLLYGLCTLYAILVLIMGGRIEVILLITLFLILRIQYVISFKYTVILLFFGIWLMSTFENIRQNPMVLLSDNIGDVLSSIKMNKEKSSYQSSNEGDVYWASERLLILMDTGQLNNEKRFEAAGLYFLSSIFPSSILPPLSNLPTYKRNIETTGGGGLAPIIFYVLFGFWGIIGLAYFFSIMINKYFDNSASEYLNVYITFLLMMTARWFAYNPIHLIKFCIWGVIIYYIVMILDYNIQKYIFR